MKVYGARQNSDDRLCNPEFSGGSFGTLFTHVNLTFAVVSHANLPFLIPILPFTPNTDRFGFWSESKSFDFTANCLPYLSRFGTVHRVCPTWQASVQGRMREPKTACWLTVWRKELKIGGMLPVKQQRDNFPESGEQRM